MSMARVNIYINGNEWCYAAWIDGEYDCSDTLGIAADASEDEARDEALMHFCEHNTTVIRVAN